MAILKLFTVISVLAIVQCQDVEPIEPVDSDLTIAGPIQPPVKDCARKHEMYFQYGPICDQTCEYHNTWCNSKRASIPGCYCEPGHVRDAKNNCVEGDSFCGNCTKNEFYTHAGSACQTECATLGKKCTIVNIMAPRGCYCDPGFARNAKGVCIPIDQCSPKCAKYEEFRQFGIVEGSCDSPAETVISSDCVSAGCYCKTNYVRHEGECIPFNQCPKKRCCLNEEYLTYGICEPTCNSPFGSCPYDSCLPAGCYCKSGFYRDDCGYCVPLNTCPFSQCDENEEYLECGSCEKKCGDSQFIMCTKECKPAKCYCKAGYVRNARGKCVLPGQCPSQQCTDGKVWTDCGTCQGTCSNYKLILCAAVCQQGCFCPSGSVIDDVTGQCIPIEKCPANQCTNGRVWLECAHCARTCANYAVVDCMGGCVDNIPGCYCPPEWVLDETTDTCVPIEQCKSCFGPNESWQDNPRLCDLYCPGVGDLMGVCALSAGCFCDVGFVRNEFGICVSSDTCPPSECFNGRVWSECGSCDITCSNRNVTCPAVCLRGCYCPSGTVLDDYTGECIPSESCPGTTCKEGQSYQYCGGCQRQCGKQWPTACAAYCRPAGCYCTAENYALNANGDCVPVDKCPVVLGCHEGENYMDCGTCENNCGDDPTGPKICSRECKPAGCYCMQTGYARNSTGSCVTTDKCPISQCDEHEEYHECGPCESKCGDGPMIMCTMNCKPAKCYCKAGYVRNASGKCVLPGQCPTQQCTDGKVWTECGSCQGTCSNYKTILCAAVCRQGCYCPSGMVVNDVTGQCIPIEKCPKCTKANEVWNDFGTCDMRCPSIRPQVCPAVVKPGCYCAKGYLRNAAGDCVLSRQCPQVQPPIVVVDEPVVVNQPFEEIAVAAVNNDRVNP